MKKPKTAPATRMLPSTERWEIYAIVLLDKLDKDQNMNERTLQGYGLAFPGEPHEGSPLGGGTGDDLLGAWLHGSCTNPSKHTCAHAHTHKGVIMNAALTCQEMFPKLSRHNVQVGRRSWVEHTEIDSKQKGEKAAPASGVQSTSSIPARVWAYTRHSSYRRALGLPVQASSLWGQEP